MNGERTKETRLIFGEMNKQLEGTLVLVTIGRSNKLKLYPLLDEDVSKL